jgi:hypothetical protein
MRRAISRPFPSRTGTCENEQARNHRCVMAALPVEGALSFDQALKVKDYTCPQQ